MKILIVGAGAVGKIYGRALAMGGAEVHFFVKEKYVEPMKKGFSVYVLNDAKHRFTPLRMAGYGVLSQNAEVKKQTWDYVLLSVSSTALRGPWLEELIAAMGNAALVTLQPGLHDREYILERFPAERLIDGTISIVSYETPLPGEKRTVPGMAYWIPPGGSAAFSGANRLVKPLLETFRRGNLAVHPVNDARKENGAAGPILNLMILALESCGWSFEKLSHHLNLKMACAAMPEAIRIHCQKNELKPPPIFWLLRPWFFRFILMLSKHLVPFDFETYLRIHFTKVRAQTHEGLEDFIAYGEKIGLETQKLRALRQKI
jgi:hypothetical protein